MTMEEELKWYKDKAEWYKMLLEMEQKHSSEYYKLWVQNQNEKFELMKEVNRLKWEVSNLKFEMSFMK